MAPLPPTPRYRTASRTALLAVLVCLGLTLTPGTGWAANSLTTADPADGAALATAPAAVVLTFSAPADPRLSHVSARDGSGAEVGSGDPARSGPTGLRLPVSIRSTGDYTVGYHVVFHDGTELVGALRFSVGTGVPPPPLGAAQVQPVAPAVAAGHDHAVDPLSASLLVADLAVLVGVVLLLRRRPRPRPQTDIPPDPDQ